MSLPDDADLADAAHEQHVTPDVEPPLVLPPKPTLADQLAWEGNKLVVTDGELLARIDKPHLSPSTAKQVRSCPARMVGERALARQTDLFSAPEKGTAAHLVLERLYGLTPALRDADHAFLIQTNMARLEPEDGQVDYMREIGADPVRYAKWTSLVHAAWRGIFDIEQPSEVNVFAREMRLDGVLVGGVPFKGFIDRIDELEDSTLKIVDYKTGKAKVRVNPNFEDDHGDQIKLYVAALEAKLDQRPSRGHLYYIEHGVQRRVGIAAGEVKKTVRAFVAAWDVLRQSVATQRFDAHPSALCGWCPLVNACPVARPATNAKDPRQDAASADELGIPTAAHTGTGRRPAAHETSVGNTADEETETTSMSTQSTWREPNKPWETDGGLIDGHLALSTPHATATIGIAEMAAEELHKAGQRLAPAALRALTGVLGGVVQDIQSTVTFGSTDWGEGSNTRARGALHTVLETIPLPFGQPAETWADWRARAVKFGAAMIRTGIDLFEGNLPADDYGPLAAPAPAEADSQAA